ncbi:selenide, water dikinase SelD [Tropicibacter oceani]|uniref:Selenide, water dikinase SelD n=1 Tax=Tropicibacter oceani TaxID=3058420 RepID=A0ABY8QGT6_9RHOB|nr:selenide, water dikinase SelD [Tropicibacter oceani]WGW03745.1 selenide, water dikinase SelD [Tropicibacter oceani]
MHPSLPFTRDLVFVGGGHTHALVLRKWGMSPLPGVRLTVINPGPTAPYSGMLPGFLAGHYDREALDIDLIRLARFAQARVILGAAQGIDLQKREIHVPGRPPIGYDLASIDIGITSRMPTLPGFAEHAVPAKPLGTFAARWADFRKTAGAASIAVIGGGVAGAEIAMALAHAMRRDGRRARVWLIDRGTALAALRPPAAARLRKALIAEDVTLLEQTQITRVTAQGLELTNGEKIEAQFITGAAGALPHGWLADTGLAHEQGFVTVDATLRSSDPQVFAVGDCAHMQHAPRPKAGVYAVRQAPILFENLQSLLAGKTTLRPYQPQDDYLKLISLGEKSALADRFGVTLSGPVMWRWKDHIDQTFMQGFRSLPQMAPPPLPDRHAAGMAEAIGPKPMCGGCGSKVGRDALSQALADLPEHGRDDVVSVKGDDAAMLKTGGARQVISTDHLRAMMPDPVLMTRIAAIHALGDIWAMGAAPQAATATIILPRMAPALARRSLSEIMQAAHEVMHDAGAAIVGGHTSLGSELTIGFTVTGLCEKDPITLAGARPGDTLILTKPIGSGVLMAAEMAGQANGDWVAAAYDAMVQPQARAAQILRGASAMTDVTGFGLAGHLLNICEASQVGAALSLNAVPFLQGALELSENGVRSTLYPENRAALPFVPQSPRSDLLFDPQTAGGLLACLPTGAPQALQALRQAGYEAAIIGEITEHPGQMLIR